EVRAAALSEAGRPEPLHPSHEGLELGGVVDEPEPVFPPGPQALELAFEVPGERRVEGAAPELDRRSEVDRVCAVGVSGGTSAGAPRRSAAARGSTTGTA